MIHSPLWVELIIFMYNYYLYSVDWTVSGVCNNIAVYWLGGLASWSLSLQISSISRTHKLSSWSFSSPTPSGRGSSWAGTSISMTGNLGCKQQQWVPNQGCY